MSDRLIIFPNGIIDNRSFIDFLDQKCVFGFSAYVSLSFLFQVFWYSWHVATCHSCFGKKKKIVFGIQKPISSTRAILKRAAIESRTSKAYQFFRKCVAVRIPFLWQDLRIIIVSAVLVSKFFKTMRVIFVLNCSRAMCCARLMFIGNSVLNCPRVMRVIYLVPTKA